MALSSRNPAMLFVFFLLLVLVFTLQTYIICIRHCIVRRQDKMASSRVSAAAAATKTKQGSLHGWLFLYLYLCVFCFPSTRLKLCICYLAVHIKSPALPALPTSYKVLAATDTFLNHKFCPRANLGRIICFYVKLRKWTMNANMRQVERLDST